MKMEEEEITFGEMKSFVKVWITIFACLTYCYYLSSKTKKSKIRFLSILPIVLTFTLLPLNFSTAHLAGTTGFFIAWLANFKLLLLAFAQGPLSSDSSSSLPPSFTRFISLACLPIKIQQNSNINNSGKTSKSTLSYAIKCLILALFIPIYNYKQHIHPKFVLFLYCVHMYISLEIMLAFLAALFRSLLGLELEPQFNEPYLSTSLQDFWGRRWNLMVTSILRPTVYEPIRSIATPKLGREWGTVPAVVATFVVSGLMHELIFFYLGRIRPTWEVTCFFALHGLCLVVESAVKRNVVKGKWQLPWLISVPLTIGFVLVTAFWLFFPSYLRCKADRGVDEYALMVKSVRAIVRKLVSA